MRAKRLLRLTRCFLGTEQPSFSLASSSVVEALLAVIQALVGIDSALAVFLRRQIDERHCFSDTDKKDPAPKESRTPQLPKALRIARQAPWAARCQDDDHSRRSDYRQQRQQEQIATQH